MPNEVALRHLREAIKSYEKEDGASPLGAYRDAVTDILHLARRRFGKQQTPDSLNNWVCLTGFEGFLEELENAEIEKVNKIPDEKLPLHSVNEFEFDVAKTQFEERLKNGGKYYGGKVPEVHSMRENGHSKGGQTP